MREIGFWDILTGAIIPLVIGVLYVRRSRKIDTFNRAAERFRAAFHDELMMLDPTMTSCPNLYGLLSKAFNKHRAAIEEFLPVLRDISGFDAGGLKEAWNQYHRIDEYPDFHHNGLIQYEELTCGSREAMRRKLLAKKEDNGVRATRFTCYPICVACSSATYTARCAAAPLAEGEK